MVSGQDGARSPRSAVRTERRHDGDVVTTERRHDRGRSRPEAAGVSAGQDPDDLAIEEMAVLEAAVVDPARGLDRRRKAPVEIARGSAEDDFLFMVEADVRDEQTRIAASLAGAMRAGRGKDPIRPRVGQQGDAIVIVGQFGVPSRSSR